jgi:hypothetical protein
VIRPYVNGHKSALDHGYRLAKRNQMRRRATDGGNHDRHDTRLPNHAHVARPAMSASPLVVTAEDSGPCRLGNEQANLNLAG